MKDQAYQILQTLTPQLCTLATCSNNQPHAAVLAFYVRNDLTVLLSTHTSTRKWKDLEANPEAALTFGHNFIQPNIQCSGTVKLIKDGEEFTKIAEEFYTAHPELQKFNTPGHGFIVITPDWLRISDYKQSPPKVEETTI